MKKLFLILISIASLFSCCSQPPTPFTIKGFLPYWNGAEINIWSNNQMIYGGRVVRDIFDYTGTIGSPGHALMKIKSGKKSFFIPVFLEAGTIKIRDAGNNILVAYGTPANDTYVELNKRFDSLTARQKISKFQDAINYKRQLANNFIKENPSSIVSLQLLKDYYYLAADADDTIYYSLTQLLDRNLQKTYYGSEMIREAQQRYSTALGRPAPYLQLQDTMGIATPLYQAGEYTLIDFWASWCIPCRKENTELVKIFQKYKPAGFTITSVSLDANKLVWLSAIRQDKMLWRQVSDLKGWASAAAILFGVKLIPMNYLVDREGVILAKNLHAEQLNTLLEQVLKK
jgi:thiol-disulfide isomerase/thioredoxin